MSRRINWLEADDERPNPPVSGRLPNNDRQRELSLRLIGLMPNLAGAHPVVVAMVDHDFTKFIWHGELFHYGFSSEGLWVIAETDDPGPEDWGIATRDPREETGVDISKIKLMSDEELAPSNGVEIPEPFIDE